MIEVNGQQFQHATSRFTVVTTGFSQALATVAEATCEESVEITDTTNSQGQIDGFTFGKQKIEPTMSLKLSEFFVVRDSLTTANPGLGLAQCSFDFAVNYGHSPTAM